MSTESAELIFKFVWSFLLSVAVLAQLLFKGKVQVKKGFAATALVVAPYLVVFGWFSARARIGTYSGDLAVQLAGLALLLAGAAGYIWSISCLRQNWTVSAAIKTGHALVRTGPYRFVRHPMYFCMTLVVLGSGFLVSNYMILLYTPVVLLLYFLRARMEEGLLKEALPEYAEYIRQTKMLVPGIF